MQVSTSALQPTENTSVKVMQMAKSQQKEQGEVAMKLIESASANSAPRPVGNAGHVINTKA
ncbi:MAG: cytoplasmic protein [Parashewanella sp.]